jgi:isopenicillin-N N-acyltransferase-like protein
MFPVIAVSGTARERGRQYGVQARDRIHQCLASYEETYAYFAGWDWTGASNEAEQFLPAIDAFSPSYVDELTGIAEGAGVELADILAINVRTEIMYSSKVRTAVAATAPSECTAFAHVASGGRVVVGQNWDWSPFALDTLVVLQAVPDDGPAYTTLVEAGLLAKFGVNSAGVAVMTNALASTEDVGDHAVPYHVMLRGLLDCRSTDEALDRVEGATRASSANYLIADSSGALVDVEARPGGPNHVHTLVPDARGALLHTNHFVSPDFDAVDYTNLVASTTCLRFDRVTELVEHADDPHDLGLYAPDSVCRHPDTELPGPDQSMTVSSILLDLAAQEARISEGPPCEHGYEELAWPTTAR